MGDVAKIVQKPREPVKRYMARFTIVRIKCSMVMTKKDYVRLV